MIQGFEKYKEDDLKCIAMSSERYISVSQGPLWFHDSLRLMNESLEKLVSNLSRDKFKFIQQFYTPNLDLVLRKGIYPYVYVIVESNLKEREYRTRTLTTNSQRLM